MLCIDKMSADVAREILGWIYEKPYDFYNNATTLETVDEMISDTYFAVYDIDNGLVGFFCVGGSAQVPNDEYIYNPDFIDIGLGMRPELTGRGYGTSFLSVALGYIDETFGTNPKRLSVAKFNHRAIHLYEKFGFKQESEFNKG